MMPVVVKAIQELTAEVRPQLSDHASRIKALEDTMKAA